jgi:Protein of unknown function (DUF4232)
MNAPRPLLGVAAAGLLVGMAVLTACSSPGTPQPRALSTAPAAAAVSSASTSRATTAPSPTAPSRGPASPPAASSSAARKASGPPPCPNGAVAVTATREGALPGEELAQLRFTNRSPHACTLTGFPGVALLASGHPIGKPALRSRQRTVALTLRPDGTVTAQLRDATQCSAPMSDDIAVYPPNQTVQQRVALQLRGCSLTIDPVRH